MLPIGTPPPSPAIQNHPAPARKTIPAQRIRVRSDSEAAGIRDHAEDAMFREIKILSQRLSNDSGDWTIQNAEACIAKRTARISFKRPHADSSITSARTAAAPRQGVKRLSPNETTDTIQTETETKTAIGRADEPTENAHASDR